MQENNHPAYQGRSLAQGDTNLNLPYYMPYWRREFQIAYQSIVSKDYFLS